MPRAPEGMDEEAVVDERSASRARVGARATSNAARGRVTFGVAFAHGCTRTQTHTRTRDA